MKFFKLIAIIAFFSLILTITSLSLNNISATTELTHIISTRGHFDQFGNPLPTKPSYEPFPFDFQTFGCPQEVVIYIHGVWTAKDRFDEKAKGMFENAPEIFERAKLSLENNGYTLPVIGFSWDSDTPISSEGWDHAQIIAKENGPKLAKFIFDLKDKCTQTKIRLIAHSLGARVVLSSLDTLNKDQTWNSNNYKITSVHLMGAAVDDDEVSKNAVDVTNSDGIKGPYGKAIEEEVIKFYNLVNSEDDALEPGLIYPSFFGGLLFDCFNYAEDQPVYYPCFEQDFALGQTGKDSAIDDRDVPKNYLDEDIKQKIRNIIDADTDGKCDLMYQRVWFPFNFVCTISQTGDNHLGYAGFRGSPNSLIDNGAMNIIADRFLNFP